MAACESTEELERELERLFRPLAPGIGFSDHGRDEGLPARITPPDTSGRQVVAWQHKGVDTETGRFSRRTDIQRRLYQQADEPAA